MHRIIATIATAMVVVTAGTSAQATLAAPGEGCGAFNPAMSTCKFTVTSDTEQQGGAVGTGDWSVTIKRGTKTIVLSSAGYYGEPSQESFMFKKGDKVTVKAFSTGAGVVAGTVF